ncbi:MAG: thiol-disulfide oxidoreductase DCC family protein [Bacteroidetes bacterium]|nr:thiol-disulfide oxidoreductase DCC family protein [Bacteroidota bacterium]
MSHPVVLFDGVCNLCNGTVQWLLKRDHKKHLRFAALQGPAAQGLLAVYAGSQPAPDSIVFVYREKVYYKSAAVLRITRMLDWPWKMAWIFILVPRFIRDFVYDYISSNRYKWFGHKNECWIPSPEWDGRFL